MTFREEEAAEEASPSGGSRVVCIRAGGGGPRYGRTREEAGTQIEGEWPLDRQFLQYDNQPTGPPPAESHMRKVWWYGIWFVVWRGSAGEDARKTKTKASN